MNILKIKLLFHIHRVVQSLAVPNGSSVHCGDSIGSYSKGEYTKTKRGPRHINDWTPSLWGWKSYSCHPVYSPYTELKFISVLKYRLPICLGHKLENRHFGFSGSFSMGSNDDLFTVGINLLFNAYFSNHLHPVPSQEGCQCCLWWEP